MCLCIFFFKQKTAYEMRSSDWSSDVCSSDLLVTLISIEATFNKVWRVKTARPKFGRFLVYWTVLTLGALVATASLALSTRFFALGIFKPASGQWVDGVLLQLEPMLHELLAFPWIYRVVPPSTVQWSHTTTGAAPAVMPL